jgi:prepilin-type processing-associated H-X9-DG protein
MACGNNLKQIALALHNYHDTYGSFPPAFIADENGIPRHSWRVLLLPFVEAQGIYDQYDFSEPWDGPNNSKLLTRMPSVYSCPSSPDGARGSTYYVAVVGAQTTWPGQKPGTRAAIADGMEHTVHVIESDYAVPWLEPRDASFEESREMLVSTDLTTKRNHTLDDFFYRYSAGRNAAWADGHVYYLGIGMERDSASAVLGTSNGVAEGFDPSSGPVIAPRPNVGNWFRLGVFAVLAVFPLPWVWLNPTSDRR